MYFYRMNSILQRIATSIAILTLFLSISCDSKAQVSEILTTQLNQLVNQEVNQNNIPGLAACIVIDDSIHWTQAFGMAHIGNNVPVEVETMFNVASISKLVIATACAKLSEDGQLDLNADINNYLPWNIVNPNHPTVPITTKQLLQHRSSLRDFEDDLQLSAAPGDPTINLYDFCLNYFIPGGSYYDSNNWNTSAPGTQNYWYSNAGFTLLGVIIKEASGISLEDYCQAKIFNPIQMNNTGWSYAAVDSTTIAMPYNTAWEPYGYYSVPEYPAAMLKSNVPELANFLITYIQQGAFEGGTVLEPSTVEDLMPLSMTNGLGWWGSDTWYGDPNGVFWSHGGFMNGVRTQLNYYPTDHAGLVILTNGEGNYSDIQNLIEDYIPLFANGTLVGAKELKNKILLHGLVVNDLLITSVKGEKQIHDLAGAIVGSFTESTIDVGHLSTGIYILSTDVGSAKFVKE
jgi:CubicO group peptidase (beta-lactamase class C family)